MGLNIEKERTAFEAWYGAPNGLKRDNNGNYLYAEANNEWRVWKAAKEQAAKQGGWISVDEKLPTEDDQYVLVWETVDGNSGAEQAFFNLPEKTFVNFAGDILKATHWQPLSAPPEKE